MPSLAPTTWAPRPATEADIASLELLIPLSARALQTAHYSAEQINSALGPVFAVDRRLIRDGTYFVVEEAGYIVGCGGWSRRQSLYGGDAGAAGQEPQLDPARDAARVRAFFIHPQWARRGIGRAILRECERAIRSAGFQRIEIVATLTGEPLYASFGYIVTERFNIELPVGLALPAVRMMKQLSPIAPAQGVVRR